jgi:hypothetical protein
MLSMPPATTTSASPARIKAEPSGGGAHFGGQSGADGGLAGWRLALTGGNDVAHQHLAHQAGIDPGPFHRFGDGHGSQLGGQ